MGKIALLGLVVLVGGCGGGSPSMGHRRRAGVRAGPLVHSRSCIATPGYGGLGASQDLFDANNNGTTGEAGPTPGAAWYQVNTSVGGCVTAYRVWDSAGPPLKARDMINLLSPYLPRDARQLVSTGSCAVWRSRSLMRATGLPYARATAVAQRGSVRSGSAEMQATFVSSC